ncbi:MAG: hypothetical protein ISR47_00325 [Rhodospirillales bacterium]|nr:hypothetical protein [Rhodospirillales bacterium]
MSEQLFSVKQVAAKISYTGDPDEITRLCRKIRHWTESEILSPFGPMKTGTGVSRVYDEHGVRVAAILLELTRHGVTTDMLEVFEEWIEGISTMPEWTEAVNGENDLVIQFTWSADPGGSVTYRPLVGRFDKLIWEIGGEPISSSIVLNLRTVLARVQL